MLKTLHDVTGNDVREMDALWETAAAKATDAGNEKAAELTVQKRQDRVLDPDRIKTKQNPGNGLGFCRI